MTFDELMNKMRDSLQAKVVYGEPYEKDGVTVIPAAVVIGGGGGGRGQGPTADEGEGGGFGLIARPVGAFVVDKGTVRWEPALDATRLILAGVLVLLVVSRRFGRRRAARAKARLRD
ncbi:MAG TPA: sporulation protein [Actinophytocola sp.]|jgi:uncharacterized spore protein YtfJ|nr:sporulation protein [Actinophytocola sp.]